MTLKEEFEALEAEMRDVFMQRTVKKWANALYQEAFRPRFDVFKWAVEQGMIIVEGAAA